MGYKSLVTEALLQFLKFPHYVNSERMLQSVFNSSCPVAFQKSSIDAGLTFDMMTVTVNVHVECTSANERIGAGSSLG